jgi:hypothetical protein
MCEGAAIISDSPVGLWSSHALPAGRIDLLLTDIHLTPWSRKNNRRGVPPQVPESAECAHKQLLPPLSHLG